jgi:hypothetical protein
MACIALFYALVDVYSIRFEEGRSLLWEIAECMEFKAKPYVPGQTRQVIQPLPLVSDSSHNTDDPQSRFDTQEVPARADSTVDHTSVFVHQAVESVRSCTRHNRIHVTEVIDDRDPRENSAPMKAAKMAEMRGLLNKGFFEIVLRDDIPVRITAGSPERYCKGDRGLES